MTDQKENRICASPFNNLIIIVVAQPKNNEIAICGDAITFIQNR
jgi:hypothetical protein